jgi:hypothetical protein
MSTFPSYRPPIGSTINYNNPIVHGLIACYPFNEQMGNIVSDLVSSRNLSLFNGPTWSSVNGGGLTFDGSNDYSENTRIFIPFNSLTFSIWVYKTVAFESAYKKIFAIGDNTNVSIYMSQGSGPQIYFGIGTTLGQNGPSFSGTLAANTWHHLVGTWNGSVVRLYINGKLIGTTNFAGTWPGGYRNSPLRVGWAYGGEYFNGTIRDFLIFDRALDITEIQSLYTNPTSIYNEPISYSVPFTTTKFLGAPSINSAESLGNNYLNGPIRFYLNSIQAPDFPQNINIKKNNVTSFSNKKSKIIEFDFNKATDITNYKSIDAPIISVSNFGTTGSTTYSYRVTAYDQYGESLSNQTITTTGNSTLNSSNYNRISWKAIRNITGYKIYGRTKDNERLLATVTSTNYYDDIGSSSPSTLFPTVDTSGYNPSKLNLGPLIQKYTGEKHYDNFIGPKKVYHIPLDYIGNWTDIIRAFEYNDDFNYVLTYYSSSAGQFKQLFLFKHFKKIEEFLYVGRLDLILSPAVSMNNYGNVLAELYNHTNGTISTSGNSVTGTNTTWVSDRIAVGARIGFGSTEARYITTWYNITAINSNTSITIDASAGAINSNTPYIIEELRIMASSRQTVSPFNQAGLYVAKGLHFGLFRIFLGNSIPMATTVDNQRAVYRLTHPTAPPNDMYIGTDEKYTNTVHYVYGNNFITSRTTRFYKFNVRASLTDLSSGTSTAAVLAMTANVVANNGQLYHLTRVHTPKTGKYAGRNIMVVPDNSWSYIIDVDKIKNNSTDFILERLRFMRAGGETYATLETRSSPDYNVYDNNLDLYFGSINRQLVLYRIDYILNVGLVDKFGSAVAGTMHEGLIYKHPINGDFNYIWNIPVYQNSDEGLHYINVHLGRKNSVLVYPMYAESYLAASTKNRLVLPKMATINASVYKKVFVNNSLNLYDEGYGIRPDAYKLFVRTLGIDDDTGQWTLLENNDLTNIQPADYIQFMFEFKIFKKIMIASRLYSLSLSYDTNENLPKELTFSLQDTDLNNNTIGFKQKFLFESLNYLAIEIYNKQNDNLIFKQLSTESTFGNFQYYNNGWVNGIGANIIGIRRRFVVTSSMPNTTYNIKIYRGS